MTCHSFTCPASRGFFVIRVTMADYVACRGYRGGCSGRLHEFRTLDLVGASRLRGKAATGSLRHPFACLGLVGHASHGVMRFAFFSALRARTRLSLLARHSIRQSGLNRASGDSAVTFPAFGLPALVVLPGQFINCLHSILLSVQKRPCRPPIKARGTAGAFLNTDRKEDYMQKTIFLNCPHCRAG